jgi:hypothetical protein
MYSCVTIIILLSSGILKIWDFVSRQCVFETALHEGLNGEEKEASTCAIVHAELCQNIQCVAVVTADHNIILFSLDGMKQRKQVGCDYEQMTTFRAKALRLKVIDHDIY